MGCSSRGSSKNFLTCICRDPLLGEAQQGRDWPAALSKMGITTMGHALTLPRPGRRTIRPLYPDGRPLAGRSIAVSLFGSIDNHCGRPAGVSVGTYRTDIGGRISFTAPSGPVALYESYYDEKSTGPAGVRFVLKGAVVTGPEAGITLRKWWELPSRTYFLLLRTSSAQPLTGAHLNGCLHNEVCGAVCGPISGKVVVSNQLGLLRFDAPDLRSMETIRVVNAAEEERALSGSELRQLMITRHLTFTWR